MQFGVVYEDGNVTGMYKDILDGNIDVIAEVLTVDNLNIKVFFCRHIYFRATNVKIFFLSLLFSSALIGLQTPARAAHYLCSYSDLSKAQEDQVKEIIQLHFSRGVQLVCSFSCREGT